MGREKRETTTDTDRRNSREIERKRNRDNEHRQEASQLLQARLRGTHAKAQHEDSIYRGACHLPMAPAAPATQGGTQQAGE